MLLKVVGANAVRANAVSKGSILERLLEDFRGRIIKRENRWYSYNGMYWEEIKVRGYILGELEKLDMGILGRIRMLDIIMKVLSEG